ncbi:MAG: TetR/AcrR family transcriptional regulator [Burkholderiales bacterium]|nr:TetR/AcrR family transcriptional regulator [Phycisphaerae bacterium]
MSATRQKLISMAFEMFGRQGFHAIGLDAIIDAVGVSKQTFYNHFESKEALVLAVLRERHEHEERLFGILFKQIAGDDPRDRLYALFDVLRAWFTLPSWRGCIFITAAAEFPLATDPAHRIAAEHTESFREGMQYLATLAGADNPRLLADRLLILVEGTVAVYHVKADLRYVEIAKEISNDLLDRHLDHAKKNYAGAESAPRSVKTFA